MREIGEPFDDNIMVLPHKAMSSGVEKPRLRAVMLQNVKGVHYICLTTATKPADKARLSTPLMKGKWRSVSSLRG